MPDEARVTASGGVIAVAGEARADLELEPDGRTTPHLGGGSFNTARTLGRLGLRRLFFGRVFRDHYGHALRAGLRESGVCLEGSVSTEDPTSFARVEVDEDGMADCRFYTDRAGAEAPTAARFDAEWCLA